MDKRDALVADYLVENNPFKIKFVKSHRDLKDGSYYITTTVIKSNGSGTEIDAHVVHKNKKTYKDILDKRSFFVEHIKLQEFLTNVLQVISNANSWNGFWIDDCSGTLTVVFDDNCMKISVDRAVTDGNNSINSLFYGLMENATL